MSFLTKLSSKCGALASLEQSLSAPTKRSLESVRSDLLKNRAEFWIRRTQNVPVAARAAKAEAQSLWANKLSQSSTWTVADLASGAVVGTQLVGCFCIGEILARGTITGYPQGAAHH